MIINYKDYFKEKIVLCLGFFDSVHVGHRKLIETCLASADELSAIPTIFTFSNNPLDLLGKSGGLIYTYEERLIKLARCGIDNVIFCHCDADMMKITATEFEDYLLEHFNVAKIIVGADYTYGHKCMGNAKTLREKLSKHNIDVEIIDIMVFHNIKIGSTYIRKLLEEGNIRLANSFLVEPYSVFGMVERGRGEGRLLGFPTANMSVNCNKVRIRDGVYATTAVIDGVIYKAITNVGNHPTFEDDNYNIETNILDFSGDLYGINIEIQFLDYLRDIIKFRGAIEISAQLQKDTERRKTI